MEIRDSELFFPSRIFVVVDLRNGVVVVPGICRKVSLGTPDLQLVLATQGCLGLFRFERVGRSLSVRRCTWLPLSEREFII